MFGTGFFCSAAQNLILVSDVSGTESVCSMWSSVLRAQRAEAFVLFIMAIL